MLIRRISALVALAVTVATSLSAQAAPGSDRTTRGSPPVWSRGGVPTPQARAVIEFVASIESRGLRPDDYAIDTLRAFATRLSDSRPSTDVVTVARFDSAMSRAVTLVLRHLHAGRVDPRALRFDLHQSDDEIDPAALALALSTTADVSGALQSAEPRYTGYRTLVHVLARYRLLARDASLRAPNAPITRGVRPGDAYSDAPTLRRLLTALGDLGPGRGVVVDSSGAEMYTGALAGAVATFQRRHGLDADSVIGPATAAQFRVPLAQRVRQIELTLERWRWLPDRPPARYAVVNIPAFRLYLFENDSTAWNPVLGMKVIVGAAATGRHTPVFVGTMREVVFRPYWDVPLSIARNELLPIIRRRPDYVDREHLEIVRGGDTDAIVYAPTPNNLDRVAQGTLRLRQRPGPDNALGPAKFVFPNRYNVYMHGTPAQSLFSHSRRDFSHGCIRVEDPTALAELVLGGQNGWDRAAIEAAMGGNRTRRIRIDRPLGVYVLYATVVARGPETVYFYPDLYGHDRALERTLALGPTTAP